MARYDDRYRDWPDPARIRSPRRLYYDRYAGDTEGRRRSPRLNRVTAPYNRDYLRPVSDPPQFNPYPFAGDRPDRIEDPRAYGYPYVTRAGTWTSRGANRPMRYDYRDFGPDYGGRYPDEL
jgi:hypothetical protein